MTMRESSPPVLPPLDRVSIEKSADEWLAERLAAVPDAAERVRVAAALAGEEEVAEKALRGPRDAAALSIREYGLGATAPIKRRRRNVGVAEAAGITRPRLQTLRNATSEVPLVLDAEAKLPQLAAECALHSTRKNAARSARDEAIFILLERGWQNIKIADLAKVDPSRIAHLRKKWLSTEGARHLVPAEAQAGGLDLLRRLIGVPIATVTGRTNTILAVSSSEVRVATDKSPKGQPVAVADVQAALDELTTVGKVSLTPGEVGYRSAFIGAVLRTLPGTVVEGKPPVLRLVSPEEAVETETPTSEPHRLTFEGDLSVDGRGVGRGEQSLIRRVLFGAAAVELCALCGDELPVRFLWAAHIKKRAVCDDDERRDVANIAMPACVFGCDALYEAGYITVDSNGYIAVATGDYETALTARLDELRGKPCSAFTTENAHYFAWHRSNMWRGSHD